MTEDELVTHEAYCHSCHRLEPVPEDVTPFIVCGECGHVYWTADELVRRYRTESVRVAEADGENAIDADRLLGDIEADTIAFCQECLHDF